MAFRAYIDLLIINKNTIQPGNGKRRKIFAFPIRLFPTSFNTPTFYFGCEIFVIGQSDVHGISDYMCKEFSVLNTLYINGLIGINIC
jgi:hypothetical protein